MHKMLFLYCFYFYILYNLIMENISELRKENIKLKIENRQLKNQVVKLTNALAVERKKNKQFTFILKHFQYQHFYYA